MKALVPGLLAIVLIAASHPLSANAQSDVIAKQRAKGIRDENNQQQGVAPATPAVPPAASAPLMPPPGPQSIAPAQQQKIDKLEADLSAIKPDATVTPEQKQQLQNDIMSLARAAKPSKDLISKLATDLSAILADKSASAKDLAPLAKNINIVVNSANLSSTQTQTFISAAQVPLKTAGASDDHLQTIANDLKAIVADLQKSKSKLYQ
jgi:hypothetical protein